MGLYRHLWELRPNWPVEVVPHPRYGSEPRITDPKIGPEEYIGWQATWGECFPETAIKADPDKQVISCVAIPYYFDTLVKCKDCGRMFIFSRRSSGTGMRSWSSASTRGASPASNAARRARPLPGP